MTSKTILTAIIAAALAVPTGLVAAPALADHHMEHQADVPMVGGAAMYPTKTIVENAVNSKDHTTLVAAVQAAGLVEALSGPGPFTVFAPTNAAFAKLPAGTVESLVKPENKDTLTAILTYHVVPGKVSAGELIEMIKKGGGKAELKTLAGGILTAHVMDGKVVLTDAKVGQATVIQADVFQSNGVIHVTDAVSLPG
ncbi:MAG: fasciclin domain-containing protein [Erythrobacter sp.]